jgi:hypothetical protein
LGNKCASCVALWPDEPAEKLEIEHPTPSGYINHDGVTSSDFFVYRQYHSEEYSGGDGDR